MSFESIYDNIISKAKSENRKRGGGVYYERHHIIPKCLGGSNSKENLVLLTAKEHFICHKLLVEIYHNDQKIFWGYHRMIYSDPYGERKIKISSREYERLRILNSKFLSELHSGKIISDEQKKFLSYKFSGERNPMFGKVGVNKNKKFTDDHKNKLSKSLTGRKFTDEHKNNISLCKSGKHNGNNNPNFGKKMSEESKRIISEKNKGNKFSVGRKYPIIQCPNCNKSGGILMMKRWHLDNCKFNQNNLGRIFIINGVGGSGKDTFVEMVKNNYNKEIINVRSSDEIKRVARILGWNGLKDEIGRKFLADLMELVRGLNDGIFTYWCNFIFKNSTKENIIFLHVREAGEIKKYVDKFKCKTIFVKRDGIIPPNNHADLDVFNYDYSIIIENNGDLNDLNEKSIYFINNELS